MSEWKKVRLGDVCDTISGTYRSKSENVVLINTSDVLEGKVLNHTYEPNKNLKGQFKKTFQKNDILYSEIRPRNKRFAFVDFEPVDYIASTKLMVLRAKDVVIPKYLYLILSSNEIIEQLQVLAESRSGTFPQITFSELNSIEFDLPPLEEQERIAKILGSLDDKIELNNKINRNLEAQAEALFKQWFVDFNFPDPNGNPYRTSGGAMIDSPMGTIPNGWSIGDVGDYCKVKSGFAFKSSWWQDSGVKVLKIKNINSDGSVNLDDCSYVAENKKVVAKDFMLKAGDLIIAMTGATIGKFAIIPQCNEVLLANQRVGKFFLGDNPIIKLPYLYCFLKQESVFNEIVNKGQGSAQPNISPTDIETISIIYNHKVIEQYNKLCFNLFCEILNKTKENASLAELRDALQPKLMNNDIRL